MFAVFSKARKALRAGVLAVSALTLAACDPSALGSFGGGGGGGPKIDPKAVVPVALLVPKSDSSVGSIAVSLENAARLAVSELQGARIDLRVYDTAGSATTAAAQAQRAVDEGAKIIIGPLRQDAVNAAGVAVADEGVNVLGFSNNPTIAGGNVFILGSTFSNTANRLMGFAKRQGKNSVVVLHEGGSAAGQLSKIAAEQAALQNGITATSVPYELSPESVTAASRNAGQLVASGAADTLFVTSDATSGVTPLILQLAPENGATPGRAQYMGLTRWDVKPELFNFPGAEGAWFTLPNQSQQNSFEARYRAANGSAPHPLAGLGYDGISAIGSMIAQGRGDALTGKALTRSNGFNGTGGIFRFLSNGTNERALAIAQVRNKQVVILDPASNGFGGAGF